MTIFKTIFETAKIVIKHPVTRKVIKTVIIIIVQEKFKIAGKQGK